MDFKDRIANNLNRKKLNIITQTPTTLIVDVERADSDVIEEGTVINAQLFKDFQNEIINEIPTKISQLTNDMGFLTEQQDIDAKLESSNIIAGTNISLTTVGNDVTINSTGVSLVKVWQGNTKLGGQFTIPDGTMSRYKYYIFVTSDGVFNAHYAGNDYNPDTSDGDYNDFLVVTGTFYNYTFDVSLWEFHDYVSEESGYWTSKSICVINHSGTGHVTSSSTTNLPFVKAIYGVL